MNNGTRWGIHPHKNSVAITPRDQESNRLTQHHLETTRYNYYYQSGCFSTCTGVSRFPLGSSSSVPEQKPPSITGPEFLRAECPSRHPTISFKPLKETQSTDPNQWPHPFFMHVQTLDGRDVAPFLHWLSNSRTWKWAINGCAYRADLRLVAVSFRDDQSASEVPRLGSEVHDAVSRCCALSPGTRP